MAQIGPQMGPWEFNKFKVWAGIWTHNILALKPMLYKLSYPTSIIHTTVVYFDQLLGANCTWELAEIVFFQKNLFVKRSISTVCFAHLGINP